MTPADAVRLQRLEGIEGAMRAAEKSVEQGRLDREAPAERIRKLAG